MADTALISPAAPLRVGSLFSGYGELDLAVEEVFGGKTIWFSEINEPVARVFSRHWPVAPNLGDITAIDWDIVTPVDILCGGFPCQDVSTVGKMAGLKPGTRSGLGAQMAKAIDALQPEWVVIETVRGLLSAPRFAQYPKATTMSNASPEMQPQPAQPLAVWNPTCGIWEKSQLDLFGQQEQFWETWPTSGMTRNGSVYPLPPPAHPTPDSASSSSPTALFRTPLASDAARGGESLQQVKARRGTIALSHQIIDLALHGHSGHPRGAEPDSLWSLIGQFFDAGDDMAKPWSAGSRPSAAKLRRPLP